MPPTCLTFSPYSHPSVEWRGGKREKKRKRGEENLERMRKSGDRIEPLGKGKEGNRRIMWMEGLDILQIRNSSRGISG